MKKLILGIVLFATLTPLIAQPTYIDSLKQLLKNSNSREQTATLQQQIADGYRAEEKYPEAVEMANQSLKTAQKISPDNLFVTRAYWILSNVYANQEAFEQAWQYVDKAYQSARKQPGNTLSMAYALYAEAILQMTLFNSEKTLKCLYEALAQIPDTDKEALLTARIYYYLYGVYTEWNDEKKSLEYILKAKEFAMKSGNKNLMANVQSAMSVLYTYRYEATRQKVYLDSIMQPLDNIAQLYRRFPGQVMNNTYAHALNNKASYYLKYYDTQNPGIKEKIRSCIEEALRVSPVDNETALANSYGMLSELSMQENDLVAAENYLMKAYLPMSQKKKPYYHTLINVLNSLVTLNSKKGNYKKALEYQQKITEYSGLLFDEQSAAVTNRLDAQFKLDKKEAEIKTLQDKANSEKKKKYLFMGLIGAGLLGSFFMFRSYHFKLKYSLEHRQKLEVEKHDAHSRIRLQEEEQARLKLERELLELQQQQLRDEVMAGQLQVQHKNKVLHQLKEKLNEEAPVNIQQIIREESLLDSDFESVKFQIQEVHPNFFRILNERAATRLTQLDQKYCAYIYLSMDTKQIAQLLNVEPKSVRMTKYRLKQKFGLEKETDLATFLRNITIS